MSLEIKPIYPLMQINSQLDQEERIAEILPQVQALMQKNTWVSRKQIMNLFQVNKYVADRVMDEAKTIFRQKNE